MLPTYPGMAPEIFHYCIVTKTKSLYLIAWVIKINRCCLAAEKIGVEAVDGNKTTSRRAKEGETISNETGYKEDTEVLDGSKSSMMSDDNWLYESHRSIYRCHGDFSPGIAGKLRNWNRLWESEISERVAGRYPGLVRGVRAWPQHVGIIRSGNGWFIVRVTSTSADPMDFRK